MPILSGQVVTADDLNHLKPTPYLATSNADLAGAVTDTDIPNVTMTINTETDNAVYTAVGFVDFDNTSATTTVATAGLVVDGVTQPGLVIYQQGISSDQMSPGGVWQGTLAVAGPHTLKLIATLPALISTRNPHTKLAVTIHEVV